MARDSVFDLYKKKNNLEKDVKRITKLLYSPCAHIDVMDSFNFLQIASNGFNDWKCRGRSLDLSDFLETISFEGIKILATNNRDYFLLFVEVVYNIVLLAQRTLTKRYYSVDIEAFKLILNYMDEVLSEMNQKAYYDPETEQCLIGEDSPQVTAAVEVIAPDVASQIMRYNHRELAGDISKKKSVLQNLAGYLEGREYELKSINKQLFVDINSAFNNLDIRHNNVAPRDSSDYKEKLAKMSPEELEKWYDDVYQLILLAILEMDNVKRKNRIRELIQELNSKEKTEDA